ncbi:MAG TPA: CDP-alcohol phosphatidyltransferase family protein [Gemmatimonadaceae bacterium]|nr:CDP-alcohol phosphatidyltransferase family protein [Gemmatimonadaceae bacterium]
MNLPNTLTISRIAAAPVVAWLPFRATWEARLAAFVLFVLIAVTDYWDGKLARDSGQVTDLGKMLDPLADKMLVVATFVPMFVLIGSGTSLSLLSAYTDSVVAGVAGPMNGRAPGSVVFPYVTPFGIIGLPWWILALVLGREIAMTVFRQLAQRRGVVIAAIASAKWKTGFQLVWVGASLFWFAYATAAAMYHWMSPLWTAWAHFVGVVNLVSMTGAVGLTAWSIIQYARQYRKLIGEMAG